MRSLSVTPMQLKYKEMPISSLKRARDKISLLY